VLWICSSTILHCPNFLLFVFSFIFLFCTQTHRHTTRSLSHSHPTPHILQLLLPPYHLNPVLYPNREEIRALCITYMTARWSNVRFLTFAENEALLNFIIDTVVSTLPCVRVCFLRRCWIHFLKNNSTIQSYS
jgi:hypothetical protein